MKILIVVPTYEEADNIKPLLAGIFAAVNEVHVLFVDDGSPDGTQEIIRAWQDQYPERIYLLGRPSRLGLGTAYIAGFRWGLKHGYDILIEMDADLSHDPQALPEMLVRLRCHDVVIGSRYVQGGVVMHWNFWRRMVSRGGSLYAQCVLGVNVHDMTGGFNGWWHYVLEGIGLDTIESEGYAFQIELKYRALRLGFTWVHTLTVHPGSSMAYNALGIVMAAQNRLGEATSHYTEALRLWPRNAQAHNNLGNALSRQGKLEEAIQHYTEALRLKPTFAEAHNNLGAVLTDQGHLAEAIRNYTTALRLQPAYPRAHYNLGNTLSRQGKLEEAIQHYTEALRLKPTFAEAHNNLGAVLTDQGHVAKAIGHYTAALRLNPRYVKAHYGLGIALFKQGRIAEARQHFSEVLRLDPNNAAARQLLEQALGSRDNAMGIPRPGVRP